MECAGLANVYYCDTDAVMVNQCGYDKLLSSGYIREGEWGMLGVRLISDKVEIRGIKYYVHDEHIVCAGMPRGRTVDQGNGESYYWQATPSEDVRNRRRPTGVMTLRPYGRNQLYHHGDVQDDGRVKPFQLEE
jgi:hypothetical protein